MKPPVSLGEQLARTRALIDHLLPMVQGQHATPYMLDQLRGLADVLELGMRAVRGYIVQTSPAVAASDAAAVGEHHAPAADALSGEVTGKPGPLPSGTWVVAAVGGVRVAHWAPAEPAEVGQVAEVTTACGQRFAPVRVLAGVPVLEMPCSRCARAAGVS